jgi:hypothetical protein
MGQALGEQFSALWQELARIHVEWQEYVVLFGTNPKRIDLLNKAAPNFFHMIQERLWDVTLLNIARLTDAPSSSGRLNLTTTRLPALIPDKALNTTVTDLVATAKIKSAFCRDWRNRRIAHNDLALTLNSEVTSPLAEASRQQVNDALGALADVMGEVEAYFDHGYRTEYRNIIITDGAEDLLYIIDDGVQSKLERIKRAEQGNFAANDIRRTSL